MNNIMNNIILVSLFSHALACQIDYPANADVTNVKFIKKDNLSLVESNYSYIHYIDYDDDHDDISRRRYTCHRIVLQKTMSDDEIDCYTISQKCYSISAASRIISNIILILFITVLILL